MYTVFFMFLKKTKQSFPPLFSLVFARRPEDVRDFKKVSPVAQVGSPCIMRQAYGPHIWRLEGGGLDRRSQAILKAEIPTLSYLVESVMGI